MTQGQKAALITFLHGQGFTPVDHLRIENENGEQEPQGVCLL